MPTTARARRALPMTALLGAASLVLATGTAHAATTVYTDLGDSYSAGNGTYDSQNSCYQSPLGYAPLAASVLGATFDYRACSGATTAQARVQAQGMSAATTLVSFTTGGNDAGFSTVMTQCALPGWLGDCSGAVATANSVISTSLAGSLATLYAQVHASAPGATVVQLGYPRLFNGQNCSWLTFFTASEMTAMNQVADHLAQVESQAAATGGVRFVDVRAPFTGHEVCSLSPWVNNLSTPTDESFHPNRSGQLGYERLFLGAVGGGTTTAAAVTAASSAASTTPVSAAGATAASTSDAQLLAAARRLPNLTSATYVARAHRAGVSAATLRAVNADLHSQQASRVRRAFQRLHQLDAAR